MLSNFFFLRPADFEGPGFEAPGFEAPGLEEPGLEALDLEGPGLEALGSETSSFVFFFSAKAAHFARKF